MKTNTQNSPITNVNNAISKLKVTAVVLMAAGWGWIGGNFTPVGAPIWNYLLHCISIVLLLIMSVQMFRVSDSHQQTETRTGWVNVAISIFAVVSIIGCIVLITLGMTNPDPNSVGVHNFADWFPTIILNMGTLLWLALMIPVRRATVEVRAVSNQ